MNNKTSKKEKPFILTAISRYVVVKEFSFEGKTESGLVLLDTEHNKNNSNVSLVMSMPEDTKLTIKAGDYVLVNPMAGFPIMIKGVQYKVVGEMDILSLYDVTQLDIKSLSAVNYKEKAGMNEE